MAVAAIAASKPHASRQELSPTEKWVIARVNAGEIADLSKQFPDQKRQISARFLENLLTGTMPGVKPRRNGVRIAWATVADPIDFINAHIPFEVELEHCRFMRTATFVGANFAAGVSFSGSTFNEDTDFNSLKALAAYFQNVVFEGEVSFVAVNIGTTFEAQGIKCNNRERPASFNSMRVGRNAFFNKARFEGPVNFVKANITYTFEAPETQFCDQKQGADFNGMKVGDDASFQKAEFEGPVDFASTNIGGKFIAEQAQFNDTLKGATFNGMKVEGVFFPKAVFEGSVDFIAADITINFEARDVRFKNPNQTVRLTVKCGGNGIFRGATFAGPISFADSIFMDLKIENINADVVVPQLDLARIVVKRRLIVERITIRDLDARLLRVEGPAYFTHLTVKQSANLAYGNFATLDLSGSVWPVGPRAFNMQGISYKYICAAPEEPESHSALLALANQSTYTADVYGNLEAFFSHQGYSADADEAFVAGKQRERREYLRGPAWVGSWLLDWLVGYGRHPWLAGIPCAFFVILGCFLFWPSKMDVQKEEDSDRVYNPFWYSLSLFVPFVDLQSHTVWKPKDDRWFLRHYMRVHTLLGWILIPILLAAISGLIK